MDKRGKRTGKFWVKWFGRPAGPPPDEAITLVGDGPTSEEGARAYQEGRYGDAEKTFLAAVKAAEACGTESPQLAEALANLAEIYRAQAKYVEAEPLYRRAIDLLERAVGPEHPTLARKLNSLALIYRAQGMYESAEPLCRRALAILEKSAGAEHPSVAPSLANLLAIYLAQGRYQEAEPLYRRSVTIKEKLLGPHHPDLAGSLNNYAALLRKTKGEAAAAAVEARAAAIRAERGRRSQPPNSRRTGR